MGSCITPSQPGQKTHDPKRGVASGRRFYYICPIIYHCIHIYYIHNSLVNIYIYLCLQIKLYICLIIFTSVYIYIYIPIKPPTSQNA